MICQAGQKTKSMVEYQYLQELNAEFEISKSQLSPNDRRSIRQRFLNLAHQCKQNNVSTAVVSLANRLADQAYKLPERKLFFKQRHKKIYYLPDSTVGTNSEP